MSLQWTFIHTVVFSLVLVSLQLVSPNFLLMLGPDDHGLIAIWDLHSGEQKQEIQIPHNGPVVALRWTSVEQETDTFAIGCGDGSVLIYTRRGVDVSTVKEFVGRSAYSPPTHSPYFVSAFVIELMKDL